MEAEHANLQAALIWSKTDASNRWLGLRLARALFWYWYPGRYLSEGRIWFESALAETDASHRTWVRATALFGSGALALYQGDLTTARDLLYDSSSIWRELNDEVELAMVDLCLGVVLINQGDVQAAQPLLEESLLLFRTLGQHTRYAVALTHLGDIALEQDDWTLAQARYEEALALQRKLAHTWGIAQALNNLGEVVRCMGDYEQAARLYTESLALFREMDTSGDIARSYHNLGYVALARDDVTQAARCFSESLARFQERANQRGIVECLAGFVGLAMLAAEYERAAQLLGMVEAQFAAIGAAMWPADRIAYARNLDVVRDALGHEAFAVARAMGRELTIEQALTVVHTHFMPSTSQTKLPTK